MLSFCGCVSEHILNIDSFCERYNMASQDSTLDRQSFVSTDNGDSVSSYTVLDGDILISIVSDSDSMNIKSVSVTCEKKPPQYYKTVKCVLSAISSAYGKNDEKYADEIMKDKEKEYANEMHTLEYISLYYTKTKSGQRFSVTYNEEITTQTTSQPETAVEYTFKSATTP